MLLEKKIFRFRQSNFVISLLSPFGKWRDPTFEKKMYPIHLRMLWAKFGWNWLSDSWEEDFLNFATVFIFWFVCLKFFVPLENSETSPLPVKGCKFWLLFGTHGHWAVRVLWRATPTVTQDIRLKWSSPRTRDTHTQHSYEEPFKPYSKGIIHQHSENSLTT